MVEKFVTLEVSHPPAVSTIGCSPLLNDVARSNMPLMFVTLVVFQVVRFWSKWVAPRNVFAKLVTVGGKVVGTAVKDEAPLKALAKLVQSPLHELTLMSRVEIPVQDDAVVPKDMPVVELFVMMATSCSTEVVLLTTAQLFAVVQPEPPLADQFTVTLDVAPARGRVMSTDVCAGMANVKDIEADPVAAPAELGIATTPSELAIKLTANAVTRRNEVCELRFFLN